VLLQAGVALRMLAGVGPEAGFTLRCQSGETADTLQALEYAKARGALCVGPRQASR